MMIRLERGSVLGTAIFAQMNWWMTHGSHLLWNMN
jgi:hypothetical protein